MKRSEFIKSIGLGIGAAVFAPKLLSKGIPKVESSKAVPPIPETIDMARSDHMTLEDLFKHCTERDDKGNLYLRTYEAKI